MTLAADDPQQTALPLDTEASDTPTLRAEFERHSPLRHTMTYQQAIAHPLIRIGLAAALRARLRRAPPTGGNHP